MLKLLRKLNLISLSKHGIWSSEATIEDVKLMKDTVGNDVEVKAAGGIHSYAEVKEMIEAGATRIGASATVQIVEEYNK